MWYLQAAGLCSLGWLDVKCIVVSVVVGFRYMSISMCVLFLLIVRSKKLMYQLDSSVALNCKLVCIVWVYCVSSHGLLYMYVCNIYIYNIYIYILYIHTPTYMHKSTHTLIHKSTYKHTTIYIHTHASIRENTAQQKRIMNGISLCLQRSGLILLCEQT